MAAAGDFLTVSTWTVFPPADLKFQNDWKNVAPVTWQECGGSRASEHRDLQEGFTEGLREGGL